MAKRKTSTVIQVADGTGGLAPVRDLRFDPGQWPIRRTIPPQQATDWLAHLDAECSERKWTCSGMSELNAEENSGSMVVSSGVVGKSSACEIVWEKQRNRYLAVRARPCGVPLPTVGFVEKFLNVVDSRLAARKTERRYLHAYLVYEGLPWLGELWLGSNLRLGPASRRASWLTAPQVIIVEAEIEGIGWRGVNANFDLLIRELCIFLSIVVGVDAAQLKNDWVWTVDNDGNGKITGCDLRSTGYWEATTRKEMPPKGEVPSVPTRSVVRPGLEPAGINSDDTEEPVPDDIHNLWSRFSRLASDRREKFLGAGNAYRIARSMWPDQKTAYAAFMVVACESLKPAGKKNEHLNIYNVVERLLGSPAARSLRTLKLPPQLVRNKHFHLAKLVGDELASFLRYQQFGDPSFDETIRELSRTARTCIIEWLRRGGQF